MKQELLMVHLKLFSYITQGTGELQNETEKKDCLVILIFNKMLNDNFTCIILCVCEWVYTTVNSVGYKFYLLPLLDGCCRCARNVILISGPILLRLQSTSRVDFGLATQFLVKVDQFTIISEKVSPFQWFHYEFALELLETAVNKPWSSNEMLA